jgi:hypothetical protein
MPNLSSSHEPGRVETARLAPVWRRDRSRALAEMNVGP